MMVGALALAGCTGGSPDPAPTGATASEASGGSSTATSASWQASPVWEETVWFRQPAADMPTRVRLYPLQRIDGRILLTVDVTPQGATGASMDNYAPFCYASVCRSALDLGLVDPDRLVRYAPLAVTADTDRDVYASRIPVSKQTAATTYRYGAFFADPGTSSVTADLVNAGAIPGVPIVDGGPTAPELVVDSADPASRPQPVEGEDADGSDLVTYPVPRPTSAAVDRWYDLVAPVVGTDITDYTGTVSLNADVLFAFNSAKLSEKAKTVLAQAVQTVQAKADPGKPLLVTGHTDNVGGTAFNQRLSVQRANAVAAYLKADPATSAWPQTVAGKGETEPVVPNTTGAGKDDPAGRALNRRVEIAYTPKPAPTPSTSSSTSTATGASGAAGEGPTGPVPSITLPAPAATLGPAKMIREAIQAGSSIGDATAVLDPVVVTGELALVRFTLTAQEDMTVFNVFSMRRAGHDLGRIHLLDPSTKTAYLAAHDQGTDDEDGASRILGTSGANPMVAGRSYTYWLYTAAPPEDLDEITVDLEPLGTAVVPVQR